MEDSSHSSLERSWSSVKVACLNSTSRMILANLNIPHELRSPRGIPRDYRGLAEQIGFSYQDLRRFENSNNPTFQILDEWEISPEATLGKLITYLEDMDRNDIIGELIPSLMNDVENYEKHLKPPESPIQVPEVTSGSTNFTYLTVDDHINRERTIYDAYVSCAKEDIRIAVELQEFLNRVCSHPLKLFIKERDMLVGCLELDTNIEIMMERCRYNLVLLTPNFTKSPSLGFLVSFARRLSIEQRKRYLIPVELARCNVPVILNDVSKIDFRTEYTFHWNIRRLIASLQSENNIFETSLQSTRTPSCLNITTQTVHPFLSILKTYWNSLNGTFAISSPDVTNDRMQSS